MSYLYCKALHIASVVAWFAVLFYLPRLFVYYGESPVSATVVRAQLFQMMRNLYTKIGIPAALCTLISGTVLFLHQPTIPSWLYVKIGFVFLLLLYHGALHHSISYIAVHQILPLPPKAYRIINEIPTVLLIVIVFLAVSKDVLSGLISGALLFVLLAIFFVARYLWKW